MSDPAIAPDPEALRGQTYGLLASLLAAAPEPSLLARLAQPMPEDADPTLPLTSAWRALNEAARSAETTALNREYHALFIGVGHGELFPYASWYRTGFLMDKPLAALRADLARLGIERQPEVREPEDHAAALCETMALLIERSSAPVEQGQFFQAHLEPWLQKFFSDLRQAKSARFYRAVGELGERFVEIEKQYLTLLT